MFAIVVVLVLVRGLVPALAHTVVIVLVLDLVLVLVAVVSFFFLCVHTQQWRLGVTVKPSHDIKSPMPPMLLPAHGGEASDCFVPWQKHTRMPNRPLHRNQEHFAFGACCLRTREFGELL